MATQRNTNFVGVAVSSPRVGADVLASDLSTVAADIGHTFEKTTGLNADGSGGASTLAQHDHTEAGNLIRFPWAHQQFGSVWGAGMDSTSHANAECLPLTVGRMTGGDAEIGATKRFLLGLPFYVPAGNENIPAAVIVNCSGGTPLYFRLLTSAEANRTTPYGGTSLYDFKRMGWPDAGTPTKALLAEIGIGVGVPARIQMYPFSVATANAVYVLEIYVDIPSTLVSDDGIVIYSIAVGPVVHPSVRELRRGNDRRVDVAPLDVTIGNPDAANTFRGLDSALFAADVPMGPQPLLCAHNLNLVHELCTGLPAPGTTTATAAGHVSEPSRTLCAWAFGTTQNPAEKTGNRRRAPSPQVATAFPNAALVVATGQFYAPVASDYTTPGTKMRAAVYCYSDSDSNKETYEGFECYITIGGVSRTYSAVIAPAGNLLHCITSDDDFSFSSGGLTSWAVYVRDSRAATSTLGSALLGVCFYLVP